MEGDQRQSLQVRPNILEGQSQKENRLGDPRYVVDEAELIGRYGAN